MGSTILAGTRSGIFRSTDSGSHWEHVNMGLPSTSVTVLTAIGNNFFTGTTAGIVVSSDSGATWTNVMSGTAMWYVQTLISDGTYLFSGSRHTGVWRRPLSEMVTSVQEEQFGLPTIIRLEQNYPNPFNPITTIQFSIPNPAFVTLKVYDLLGREVCVLVNEKKAPGSYEVTFDGTGLSSGVYFYRLQAGEPSAGSSSNLGNVSPELVAGSKASAYQAMPQAWSRGFVQTRKLLLLY